MKLNLRTLVLAPVALAVVALTAQSAMAAATVKVPFSFTVGSKVLPAGLYTVDRDWTKHIVSVHSVGGAETFNWVLNPANKTADENRVTLRFNEAGDSHTLKSVQFGSESTAEINKQAKHSRDNSAPAGQGK